MKTKAHIRYRLKKTEQFPKGEIVKGTTTVTGGQLAWNKNILMNWANKMGLKGIDSNKYADDKADIGSLAHAFITDELIGKKTDTSDYTANQITEAENAVLSFYEWQKHHDWDTPIFVEKPLVSEEYKYGGTIDIYWMIDGRKELTDLKTGGVWPEHFVQVGGGYVQLLNDNGFPVERVRILNIPRTKDEEFGDIILPDSDKYWQVFEHCLALYDLKKRF